MQNLRWKVDKKQYIYQEGVNQVRSIKQWWMCVFIIKMLEL